MRGATDDALKVARLWDISIHAPRAGRDNFFDNLFGGAKISIHAPRAGRDPDPGAAGVRHGDFNPRAPCGARLYGRTSWPMLAHFNPRAPCGARPSSPAAAAATAAFQSTRPVRGATLDKLGGGTTVGKISIHAPRAGRDHLEEAEAEHIIGFQSTRPVRGATMSSQMIGISTIISIHAPRAGRDS